MHRIERRLTWVSVAVLAVCALDAADAAWPADVNEQADAVVQRVVHQSQLGVVRAPGPTPLPTPTISAKPVEAAASPAAASGNATVNVIGITATDGPRSFAVTI